MINNRTSPDRSTEEYIILTLSCVTCMGILPFAIYRLIIGDWAVAILDMFAVVTAGALYCYVYRTHSTRKPAQILAFLSMFVAFSTIVLKGSEQLLWIYPALTAIFFLLPANFAALLSTVVLIGIGAVLRNELNLFITIQFYVSAIATLIFSYAFADRMRKQQEQLTELATKDPLTDANNRRAMEQKLLDIIAFQRRDQSKPASLILMDLDKFKDVNDHYGHARGDDILVAFVKNIQNRIRATDRLYRFGGEEFVVIAENTPLKDAMGLAEELRVSVEQDGWLAQHKVTISIGTAKYAPDETAFEWLGRADKAMYQAKEHGRNICRIA